jgi:hypothetical protein
MFEDINALALPFLKLQPQRASLAKGIMEAPS